MFAGPFRAASKAGVFITMLVFHDIYSEHGKLNERNTLEFSRVEGMLGGYTFSLDCWLWRREHGNVDVSFDLSLRGGRWDDYVEWPFSKKVTVIVPHPKDREKDIRLHMHENGDDDPFEKPATGSYNPYISTAWISWKEIELNGFVFNGTLCVNLEFD
ncbi:hypothetical protein HPB50_009519 [Hyalomma asiaticum]|uniref:Uncharacterized protein n=1 Tax=Hyalomma asiaticum TaxID=266040 RepID=A0ACB7RJX5_HYAAI|nr:hypothetical protein HPB50_009519 [Hyalomma asiaticum]